MSNVSWIHRLRCFLDDNMKPNLLHNCKKEFLDYASVVLDDKREKNLKDKLAEERMKKA